VERRNTQNIGDVIRAYLKQSGLEKPLKERQLIQSWESLLGKTVARATTRIFVKDRKLFVYLRSSVIRNELFMLQKEILKKLNEAAGEEILDEIILK
jgi:predicted nucleic acid-binding Zn ribbon protein